MILMFAFPSSPDRTGGIVALYEYANALARREHEVHFVHGPLTPYRVERLDEIPFRFDERVRHHLVDSLDDPRIPRADVVFHPGLGDLGLPAVWVQGYRMIGAATERDAFRARAPKICVARWLVDVVRSFGVPEEQLWYVPLGLDHATFAFRTPLEDRIVDLALMHNSHREKGWRYGLEALRILRARRPDLAAVVFGRYTPRAPLPDGVPFVQFPDHRSLADEIYGRARVFVQPSLHEGFGLTAIEAMACGAALVSTDNGGSRDYAFHDETALVVPPGDASAIADAVETLLDDDEMRSRIAQAGVRHARTFDWDCSARDLEPLLEAYVADPAAYQRPPAEDVDA